ncbi:MAG: cupin domain-containing protein [Alphaproteobacteria bacterium]|nr:cupin domain-containing protein [Alphaproteobacteria bacterium]
MDDDTTSKQETEIYVKPGEPGHNLGTEVVWARWQKKRTFVRALEGTYGEVYKSLYAQPRVIPSSDFAWKGGPQLYGKTIINPQSVEIAQSIECHLNVFSPHGTGQKHGHMNSAVFYILHGTGHDVHDGVSLPYVAGDAAIVESACVHQHFNDGDDQMAVLVMKAKPLFLFMHMIFQKVVDYPPKEPSRGGENYTPPDDF